MARPRLHRPRTVRTRLTLLYSVLFLASGALMLGIANVGVRVDRPAPIGRDPFGAVVLPAPRQEVDRLAVSSGFALVVGFLVSVGIGWIVAGRTLRPLRTITAAAQAISASNLHERLNLQGPDDEITELGATLDDLLGRLEASFESQRHFVANASHELRTPLTAERALLQVALADPDASIDTLRATCEDVLALGAQQERLIAALLTLATGERGLEHREVFDLALVAQRAVDQRRGEADRRGIAVDCVLGAATASGDPRLVESLVANLVENAIRHNLPEGEAAAGARVEVWTGVVDGRSVVRVGNTGPAVPPDHLGRLFEPFQRLGDERVGAADAGHGLGLAIVGAIAESHGATVAVRARLSGGLDVEVAFSR